MVVASIANQWSLLINSQKYLRKTSGVGTGGSGGSMNRGPRAPGAPGAPSSRATEKF